MSDLSIRHAEGRDLPALTDIYNHYVRSTHVTFDVEPFGAEQRRGWFATFADVGPHRCLVAEVEGRCVGYASSGPLRPKPAYARSVETTIYLDPASTGQGVGWRLYGVLFSILEPLAQVHRGYAVIALPNPGSIAFHERFGFHRVGTLDEVGFKFDRYWDIAWYEKDLSGE